MSQRPATHRVVNQRDQPVELHCGGRTVVLAPHATAELAASETDTAQVRTLARRGLIELRAVPEPPAAAVPTTTTAAEVAAPATRKAKSHARGGKVK